MIVHIFFRDALRVSLHLVEKSLQRIVRGQKNAMYTTQKSIENKVGHVTGWKELLMSVGFRFVDSKKLSMFEIVDEF